MIDADFIFDNLSLSRSPFVDPVGVKNWDLRREWTCCQGTEFEVRVLAHEVDEERISIFDRMLMTIEQQEEREAANNARAIEATHRAVAKEVAEAMGAWSAHKKMRLLAAVEATKRETECPIS